MEYVWRYPLVEALAFIILTGSLIYVWWGVEAPDEEPAVERQLGTSVLLGQLSGTILAGTIVLGLLGAFAALKQSGSVVVNAHVEWAVTWALLSLVISVYGLGMLPSVVWRKNPIRVQSLAFPAAWGLFFFVAAAGRFFFALWGMM